MNAYVGTYSDEAIIDFLKKEGSHKLYKTKKIWGRRDEDTPSHRRVIMSDEEIKKNIIDKGKTSIGLVYFFAGNLNDAKQSAKQMRLKNFAKVDTKIYTKGEDFK